MLSPPQDLSTDDIRRALKAGWDIEPDDVDFLAVGFGSHHWAAGGWFVTADRADDQLETSLRTATALRDSGLEFVVAPIATKHGRATQPAGTGYLLAVYPFVSGQSGGFDEHPPGDKEEVRAMLARLHASPITTTPLDLDPPQAGDLRRARHTVGDGPYGRRASELLHDRGGLIDDLIAEYEELRAGLPPRDQWVVTHGEPHPGNVMRTPDGLRLVDWDTVRLAPEGNDLWHVDYEPAYAFFRLRWRLADIASFAADLSRPHADTEDTSAIFGYLRECLAYEDT